VNAGSLFCRACGSSELTNSKRSRCARCGSTRILAAGSLRALVVQHKRGQVIPALTGAVKRLLLEAGASWP
jgi:hypothetical protein